jgi:hypothetical protein
MEASSGRKGPSRKPWWENVLSSRSGEDAAALRARYGVLVVLAGLAVILVAFVITVIVFEPEVGDVSTALAPITGVIGTIVGAYFGVQVGGAGKEQAEAARDKAEDQAKILAAVAPPAAAAAVLGYASSEFGNPKQFE